MPVFNTGQSQGCIQYIIESRIRPHRPFAMLQYKIVPVTPFEQNCSLLWCDVTRKAAVVDPGGDLSASSMRQGSWGSKSKRSS